MRQMRNANDLKYKILVCHSTLISSEFGTLSFKYRIQSSKTCFIQLLNLENFFRQEYQNSINTNLQLINDHAKEKKLTSS